MFKEVFAAATQLHTLPVIALVIFFTLAVLIVAWTFRPGSRAYYAQFQNWIFDEKEINNGKK